MATKKTTAKTPAAKPVDTAVKVSLHTDSLAEGAATKLPSGTVKVAGENGLAINVAKLSTSLVRDQRARMVSSDGCISNPGGPSC
jgi:hypothetical protein